VGLKLIVEGTEAQYPVLSAEPLVGLKLHVVGLKIGV